MSASPVLFSPAPPRRAQSTRSEWLLVVYALLFISLESTTLMGGAHTQIVVNVVWKAVLGTWHWNLTGLVNGFGRKVGHFFGYGVVSLIFRNAWYKSARALSWVARTWLTPFAASLAVASTFVIACLDEWHQKFLPGRVGCLRDVLLDATGAIVLNAIFGTIMARRRKRVMERSQGSAVAMRSR